MALATEGTYLKSRRRKKGIKWNQHPVTFKDRIYRAQLVSHSLESKENQNFNWFLVMVEEYTHHQTIRCFKTSHLRYFLCPSQWSSDERLKAMLRNIKRVRWKDVFVKGLIESELIHQPLTFMTNLEFLSFCGSLPKNYRISSKAM